MMRRLDRSLSAKNLITFFRELWERSSDPFWICESASQGWRVIAANPAAQAIDPRQGQGAYLHELVAGLDGADSLVDGYKRLGTGRRPVMFEQRPVIEGEPRLFETLLVPIFDAEGRLTHAWGTSRDRTAYLKTLLELQALNQQMESIIQEKTRALIEANERLSQLSLIDGLTGVANRRHFDQFLRAEIGRLRRNSRSIALFLLDIDHFKRFNDNLGHVAGDGALKAVADVLRRSAARSGELVARYGGEEFAVVLPECDENGARAFASRFEEHLRRANIVHPDSPTSPLLTLSGGAVITSASEVDSAEDLVRSADEALYQSKQSGRNRITFRIGTGSVAES